MGDRTDLGTLEFDGGVAVVSDFEIGEAVEVSLEPDGATYRVERVEPVGWRAGRFPEDAALAAEVADVQRVLAGKDVSVIALDEDMSLTVQVRGSTQAPPPTTLVFEQCVLLQITPEIDDAQAITVTRAGALRQAAPELVAAWPRLDDDQPVYRIAPGHFGAAAWYVAARRVRPGR